MADFLQKVVVANNQQQVITVDGSMTAFDFVNNSPFDVDIAFGQNRPADLTVPASCIWRGVRPSKNLLISGNQWSGQIVATPSYPLGGTPPANSPALQLGVMGYAKGNEPDEQIIALGNNPTIGNNVLQAASVINTGNIVGTVVVEAIESGDSSADLLIFNDGSGNLSGGLIVFDGAGNITAIAKVEFNPSSAGGDMTILQISDSKLGSTLHTWALIYNHIDGSLNWQDLSGAFTAAQFKEDQSGNLSAGQISWNAAGLLTAPRLIAQINLGGSNRVYYQLSAPDGPQVWNLDLFTDLSFNIVDQTNNKTSFKVKANAAGTVLDASGKATLDGTGVLSAVNLKLTAANQETGHFHFQGHAGAAETWQFYVRFRQQMTNTPSSITLSSVTSTNVTSENVSNITTDGFQLNVVVTAAGLFMIDLTWATVGN